MNKKRPKSKINQVFKRIINVRSWSDWDRVRAGGAYVSSAAKGFFVPNQQKPAESFEEAKARLHLSDDLLAARARSLYRNAWLLLVIAVGLFCYSVYHMVVGTWHAALWSIALMTISLGMAFRYHFWYFQIKQKKLGCSIHDWFREGIMGDKS